ncbi:hypothetical protein [Paenibacillus sp. P32E]|uniref:hypothetical protein n=1 Tax=Paenibacillus sp. P32E TaxID=1349434 RepID=UPI00093C5D33|nr:hypothetical protein [Paenibacillus sp. P32E]OKP89738.1 hypothetical protein A3848_13170 [Paenibacillus sp. P32E]
MEHKKIYMGSILIIMLFLFIGYDSNDNVVSAENTKSQELKYFYDQNRIDYIYSEDDSYVDFYYDRNGNQIKKIQREAEGFEKGDITKTSYIPLMGTLSMAQESNKVINGAYSAYGVGAKDVEWTVFMISNMNKVKLEPNTSYSVTFNYRVVDTPASGGYFDFFVRTLTGGNKDVGWATWNEALGSKGSKRVEFVTGAYSDYFLNFGMHYGGAISIDDIKITKEGESFEKGDITTTSYIPLIGTLSMAQESSKVVNGAYSAYGVGAKDVEWTVFMISNMNKVKLEPNTSYSVTFNYKVVDTPASGGYFDFFVRTLTGGNKDVGWAKWNEAIGTRGSKRVEFVTGAYSDYFLNFGMHYGGAISIDDIKITKEGESFEKGDITTTSYIPLIGTLSMTQDSSKVVNGAYSAYGVGAKDVDWTVFMISNMNKIKLEPNTSYSVSFNYKVIDTPASGGYFDFFVRTLTGGNKDVGWATWNEAIGTRGSKRVEFVTGAYSDYFLNFGMHYGGAISIDDIKITKEGESFEKGDITTTSYTPLIGTLSITQESNKVVNGAYSAYGVGAKNVDWTVFMISNMNKIKLEPNTSYSVTFNYKVIDTPASGGYFDFFVRTLTGGNKDVGWATWNEAIGTRGSKRVEFVTGAYSDYFLNFGMHYGGAISIDDIKISMQ